MTSQSYSVHPNGICESEYIGDGTRVWAFAHILPGAVIGSNCNVCDGVFIENDVVVGDNVTIKCGVQLWDGVRIGSNVFIGPNATLTNDKFPRSKVYPEKFAETVIEDFASIGANATILPGINIGRSAMIGAGAVVTKSVPANAVVVGNPAVIVGYQTETGEPERVTVELENKVALNVGRCELWRLPRFADLRGQLAPLEYEKDLPFVPKRSFIVHGVPSNKVRGEHAHHQCKQFLIAVHGSVSVVIDDGTRRKEVQLSDPSTGLYLSPLVWGIQYKFEPNSVLLVFASDPYEASDYIREYKQFLELVNA
ncbi:MULTISPECIES: WxcM-like domain-containing protein [unclassified Rhizobium]|uniref:WxcM-like domain-containing protein n=1 Tax=unclassified Rhizobium TaxID=2613769 RepID=UPI001ADB8FC7|nr:MULTISPECIES: WxcM-like domain-containing protein [unclassified Rhizobium]MBO9123164.1 WxcM-like domain-containing protein [Rhizobium sp. 16-488-2b]MBO9173696.1 WxcM-like domain-containing protein [Rhizobium sp. 16-488-2a]